MLGIVAHPAHRVDPHSFIMYTHIVNVLRALRGGGRTLCQRLGLAGSKDVWERSPHPVPEIYCLLGIQGDQWGY